MTTAVPPPPRSTSHAHNTCSPCPSTRAATVPDAGLARHREVVNAFLAAARGGGFDALVATQTSCSEPTAQPRLVNGAAGAVWAPGGRPRVVFSFTITRGKIVEIDLLAEPERLRQLDLAVLYE